MNVRALLVVAMILSSAAARADTIDVPRFRNERVMVDPVRDVAQAARTSHIAHTLFVNRCPGGCNITPGVNDARTNTSSIVPGATTITEFNAGDEIFDATIECLRDVYGPYDVNIVTDDPGTEVFHHEAILAGYPAEA